MIMALITWPRGNPVVWAFDDAEQFSTAVWHARRHNIAFMPVHALDRQNRPFALTIAPDDFWLRKSAGVNDADEFERHIYQHDLNLPVAPMNEDHAHV